MVWPIPPRPTTRANDTAQFDTHPAEHNAVNDAINELFARLPRGEVARVQVTAPFTNAAGPAWASIPGATISFTGRAGRKYRAFAQCPVNKANNLGDVAIAIFQAQGGVQLAGGVWTAPVTPVGHSNLLTVMALSQFAVDTAVTWYLQIFVQNSSATVAVSATYPLNFVIDDVGPITGGGAQ